MTATLTIRDDDYARLRTALGTRPGLEGAAYLLCGRSEVGSELRLLAREVVPVADDAYLVREADRLSIASPSYAAVAKRAAFEGLSVLFVHLHPDGYGDFSRQDDREEPKLMAFLADRAPATPHGSLVLGVAPELTGRVWAGAGWAPLERVRVLGRQFRFIDRVSGGDENAVPTFFDRQVRAFGPDVQRLLHRLHVGVVGLGGTGSAVAEQLYRLGVGTLALFDGEDLEHSNVSRVYGATTSDVGRLKVEIAAEHLRRIGLDTVVHAFPEPITREHVARELRACDVVFGCTDRQAPRAILQNLALAYLIPVFDLGVKIDAPDREIRGVDGRLTILWPGEACLFCRERISPEIIALEALSPDELRLRIEEGYAPSLEGAEPAVVPFTTAVAAKAIGEFLHRLTGWMGEMSPSEFRIQFHDDRVGSSNRPASASCFCAQRDRWGTGDRERFLGLTWTT